MKNIFDGIFIQRFPRFFKKSSDAIETFHSHVFYQGNFITRIFLAKVCNWEISFVNRKIMKWKKKRGERTAFKFPLVPKFGCQKKKKGLKKSIIAQLELEDYLGSKSRHRHLLLRTAYQLPIDSSIDPIFNLRPAEKTRSHPR